MRPPCGTTPSGSRSGAVTAAATRYMAAVSASAQTLPTVATSPPAIAGPKMLETTYPLLSIAFARSQSGRGTSSGKSVRTPVVESGNVTDIAVTMTRSRTSLRVFVAPRTTMSVRQIAATM